MEFSPSSLSSATTVPTSAPTEFSITSKVYSNILNVGGLSLVSVTMTSSNLEFLRLASVLIMVTLRLYRLLISLSRDITSINASLFIFDDKIKSPMWSDIE